MISRILFILERGLRYLKEHPQLLFILILLFVIPVLFLHSGQRFLDVGRENQERIQKDRIGILQDAFTSVLITSDFSPEIMQREIERITKLNPDIIDFNIARLEGFDVVPIAALNQETIGLPIEDPVNYKSALVVAEDESLIREVYFQDARWWLTYKAVQDNEGTFYFIYTLFSFEKIDNLFKQRERDALYSLFFVYIFIMALAYWHIRLTDYRYLYIKVQKANEMKDLFANMIAHELRAPLTAIKGYSSMMNESLKDPEQQKHAKRITDSAERLLTIVNDLLDVARIQSGKLAFQKENFDVSEVVIAVIDELHISAQEKNIILKHIGTDTSHVVMGDRMRLHQAITNLVSNAIKYTNDGEIELSVAQKFNKVVIRVKDTGMGISAEDQKQLFAPFFRVKNDDVSQITGTGLGMWITKQLIELMGAKIGVESIKGVGTHIVVTLNKTVSKER